MEHEYTGLGGIPTPVPQVGFPSPPAEQPEQAIPEDKTPSFMDADNTVKESHEHEAESDTDGTRVPDEEKQPRPTIQELLEQHKPAIIAAVMDDAAYRNACGHSDHENYMIYGEMYDEIHSTAIGVACHELGHTLGLFDLCNVWLGSQGIGCYSLMAFGNWGYTMDEEVPGTTPVALDAWSKYTLGYITPIEYEEKIFDIAVVKSIGGIDNADSARYNALKVKNTPTFLHIQILRKAVLFLQHMP